MKKNELQQVVRGAFVLSIASFIAKLLSAVYRVPFQNIVGDEGFYAYQQVYPIYGLGMTLALNGLPVFLSKVIAGHSPTTAKKILRQFYPLVVGLSLILFAGLFWGHNWLARLMGDIQLAPMIRMVALLFLLVPGLAFRRGYYQGQLWMIPTALSQVVEQLVRIGVILFAAWEFSRLDWSIYRMGTFAMSGALVGGLAAYGILLIYAKKLAATQSEYVADPFVPLSFKTIIQSFFCQGGLICLYSAYLVVYQLFDSFTVKKALLVYGLPETTARITKGIYDRGQPLVQLGLVVSLALSSTFLPLLTKYHKSQEDKLFAKTAATFIKITALISLAATLGLIMLLPLINYALFEDTNGQTALAVFVGAIALMALITVFQSIYQSMDFVKMPAVAAISGLVVKLLINYTLTRLWGPVGASLSTLIGLAICLIILWVGLPTSLQKMWLENRFIWKLLLIMGLLWFTTFLYTQGVIILPGFPTSRFLALLLACGGVAIGCVVVGYSVIKLNVFTAEEWLNLPFGSHIKKNEQSE